MTSRPARRTRTVDAPRARRALAVAVPLLVGAALAGSALGYGTQRARLEADVAVRSVAAVAVGRVDTAVRAQIEAATDGNAARARVLTPDQVRRGAFVQAAVQARDSGRPVVDDLAEPPAIVVPLYRAGAPVADTAARRKALTGYRVTPLVLESALAGLDGDGTGAGVAVAVAVVRGSRVPFAADAGPAPDGARTFTTPIALGGADGWALQAWAPDPGTSASAWAWAASLLALGVAVAEGIGRALRRARADAARQARLERQQALVTELAPVVQSSLDLGEVAPAVATHLARSLDLAGVTLSVPSGGRTEGGRAAERPVFSWGTAPDRDTAPATTTPDRLDAGRTYAIPLTRGGRVLGVLRVVAGEPLAQAEVRALTAASELLSSLLANVALFEAQQLLVERLRSLDELKTAFLATASHQLRTPVAAIVGFSSLLLDCGDTLPPEQARTYLERVQANGQGLDALIEQLLDFSRLERGMGPAGDEVLDLGASVARILDDRPELTAHHACHLSSNGGAAVRGSAYALERIVTNLVSNAAKYSPRGCEVAVTVRADGDRAELVVDDEGPGVRPEDRARIFGRFYRGHGDLIPGSRGAGVGLAIVAEYAASMSGAVTVGDSPSGGARFTVSFPSVQAPVNESEKEGSGHVVHP